MRLFGYKYTVDPLLKTIVAYIFILALLVAVVCLSGCGTRNKTGETTKGKKEQTDKSTSEGNVNKESGTSEESSTKEKDKAVDENLKQTVTELYYENGQLKSRVTELEKQKQSTTSTKDKKSLKTQYNRVDSTFNVTNYKNVVVTTYQKKVDVESDKSIVTNVGGKWTIIILGMVALGLAFLYFKFK